MLKWGTRDLPVLGEKLTRLYLRGNGKRSDVTIEVQGARKIIVPLQFAMMHLEISGPVMAKTRDWGDTEIVLEIAPKPRYPITIDEAAIDFPDSKKEWDEILREYAETNRRRSPGVCRSGFGSLRRAGERRIPPSLKHAPASQTRSRRTPRSANRPGASQVAA